MSLYHNNKKIKEMYYNGQKIKEAYYNGEKVFSGENVLFEDDVYFAANATLFTLPTTYPVGCSITWTPAAPSNTYSKGLVRYPEGGGSAQESQMLDPLGTEFISTISFNTLSYFAILGDTPAITFHIKIIGA